MAATASPISTKLGTSPGRAAQSLGKRQRLTRQVGADAVTHVHRSLGICLLGAADLSGPVPLPHQRRLPCVPRVLPCLPAAGKAGAAVAFAPNTAEPHEPV